MDRSVFSPEGVFFDSVGNRQELGPALLFGIIVGWVSAVLSSLASMVFQPPLLPLLGQQEGATEMFVMVGIIAFFVFLGWLIPLFGIIISGEIVHLFLLIFGGAKQGSTMTLRVLSYAYAPQIFVIVPFLGGCVATVWMTVLVIIGLASVHRTDTWRAALAVLTPILLCTCFYAATLTFCSLFCAVKFLSVRVGWASLWQLSTKRVEWERLRL
ncbi:MAG: YIP1 family protein [Candidatus Fervidibacter sp.]|uniref:YIP1 family protein n=1 Tax=Candidatus Fervidibacter sp. TaxID=3100871 RepID=UPI00404A3A1C